MRAIKKREGFTIVELLVTISILAIISIVFVLSYNSVSKKVKNKQYSSIKNNIKLASKKYFSDKNSKTVYVDTLIKDGYIVADNNGDINNPVDGNSLNCAKISMQNGDIIFDENNTDCSLEVAMQENISILATVDGTPVYVNQVFNKAVELTAQLPNIEYADQYPKINWSSSTAPNTYLTNECNSSTNENCLISDKKLKVNNFGGNYTYYLAVEVSEDIFIYDSITLMFDKTDPIIKDFKVESSEKNYNSNKIKFTISIEDEFSDISYCIVTSGETCNYTDLNKRGDSLKLNKELSIGGYEDGKTYEFTLFVKDQARNIVTSNTLNYKMYKYCSQTIEKYSAYGNCNAANSCGKGTKTRIKDIQDKYFQSHNCSSMTETATCEIYSGCCTATTSRKQGSTICSSACENQDIYYEYSKYDSNYFCSSYYGATKTCTGGNCNPCSDTYKVADGYSTCDSDCERQRKYTYYSNITGEYCGSRYEGSWTSCTGGNCDPCSRTYKEFAYYSTCDRDCEHIAYYYYYSSKDNSYCGSGTEGRWTSCSGGYCVADTYDYIYDWRYDNNCNEYYIEYCDSYTCYYSRGSVSRSSLKVSMPSFCGPSVDICSMDDEFFGDYKGQISGNYGTWHSSGYSYHCYNGSGCDRTNGYDRTCGGSACRTYGVSGWTARAINNTYGCRFATLWCSCSYSGAF